MCCTQSGKHAVPCFSAHLAEDAVAVKAPRCHRRERQLERGASTTRHTATVWRHGQACIAAQSPGVVQGDG